MLAGAVKNVARVGTDLLGAPEETTEQWGKNSRQQSRDTFSESRGKTKRVFPSCVSSNSERSSNFQTSRVVAVWP